MWAASVGDLPSGGPGEPARRAGGPTADRDRRRQSRVLDEGSEGSRLRPRGEMDPGRAAGRIAAALCPVFGWS